MNDSIPFGLQLAWFVTTLLFVIGLRRLSSPSKARSGIWLAGIGMLIAIASMYFHPESTPEPIVDCGGFVYRWRYIAVACSARRYDPYSANGCLCITRWAGSRLLALPCLYC